MYLDTNIQYTDVHSKKINKTMSRHRAGQAMSRYVPPCPAIGRDSWQDRGAGQKSRTPRPAIGRDKAGHSRTSPVPPCGGTTAEDVFMYCPALWRDKLSVHYLLGRFFFNRAVLAKTLRLACIVEGPRWGSPISCLVFCRVGPPKRKRPKEVNWWCSMARRSP